MRRDDENSDPGGDGADNDRGVAVKAARQQSMYGVLMLNDDYPPMGL